MKKVLILLVIPILLMGASLNDTTYYGLQYKDFSAAEWNEYWGICFADTIIRDDNTEETTFVFIDLQDNLSYHGIAIIRPESTTVKYKQSADSTFNDIDFTTWFSVDTDTTEVFKTLSLHPARFLQLAFIETKKDTANHIVWHFTGLK